MRLKLKYGRRLSSFAFKFNLRRYTAAPLELAVQDDPQGVTIVHFSAQPERETRPE
jgi:hypothetical protein